MPVPLADVWAAMPTWGWVVLGVTAFTIGFSKTAVNGLGTLCIAVLAMLMPARESTGVALLLLLVGDIVAVIVYRKNVEWKLLANLILPVLLGLGLGTAFLSFVDDLVLKRTIGVVLLVLLLIGLLPVKVNASGLPMKLTYGSLAGFTTMVANAGGPAMNLYLLASKFDKWRFIATTSWFFFAVNVTKVPFQIAQGIIVPDTARLAATLAALVLLGCWIGRLTIDHINQHLFDTLVIILTAISALYLIFG
ncbi:MAG: sulfite exporter TauE/SafE family protein [Propionibacteriaceae bacterium]|jgi:uncharacterized membrane protein YfcA|nr:sulfite exporter TauE/SafE family protein [Propionibacteriaceae bacterium]